MAESGKKRASRLAILEATVQNSYQSKFLSVSYQFLSVIPPGKTKLIGLPPREVVFGIDYNNIQRAYPLTAIVDKEVFEDSFGGKVLVLKFDKTGEFLSAEEPASGTLIIVEKH